MRIPMRAISLASAGLALILFSAVPRFLAFASGDDKRRLLLLRRRKMPRRRPDREKKVYTNDDIDRMWPRANNNCGAQSNPMSTATRARKSQPAISRGRIRGSPTDPAKESALVRAQVAALSRTNSEHRSAEEGDFASSATSGSTDTRREYRPAVECAVRRNQHGQRNLQSRSSPRRKSKSRSRCSKTLRSKTTCLRQ